MTDDPVASHLDRAPEPTRTALAMLCRIIAASDSRIRGESAPTQRLKS
ncbi:MAG: hypothetical protein ABWX92_17450 [Mycetocola sp.]